MADLQSELASGLLGVLLATDVLGVFRIGIVASETRKIAFLPLLNFNRLVSIDSIAA